MIAFRTSIACAVFRFAALLNRFGWLVMPATERVLGHYDTRFIAGEDGKIVDLRSSGL